MVRTIALPDAQSPPQADQLEGFPHPRETTKVFGHTHNARALQSSFDSGRMHHAWLFTGPPGIGKATLSYKFAIYALAREAERNEATGSLEINPHTITAQQVLALSHPALLVLRRPYDHKTKRHLTTIPVDEVRRVRGFLAHTTADASWRLVIVDAADDLNINAANALLKSLEEPPARTTFILICARPGALPNTIRSRCRTLEFAPLANKDLQAAVTQVLAAGEDDISITQQDWIKLLPLAHGSVRDFLSLHTAKGAEIYDDVLDLLRSAKAPDWQAAHHLADRLAPAVASEKYELFFQLFLQLIPKLIRAHLEDNQPDDITELARSLISDEQLASWARLWETVAREKADAAALNLDRKALIIDTVSQLQETARL